MAAAGFDEWLGRGRAHQHGGRPADAIPCFRRAARLDPQSPLPWFHLGEVLWQLGLANEALQSWRSSAQRSPTFSPASMALAEAALTGGDYAAAAAAASSAAAIDPNDERAQLTAAVASAALGDATGLRTVAQLLERHPGLARNPALAPALDRALAQSSLGADERHRFCIQLAADLDALPPLLLAAVLETGVAPQAALAALATHSWAAGDVEALRRIAVAVHARHPELAGTLATAYASLQVAGSRPTVPLLWPRRTGGASLRVAWLLPPPADPLFVAALDFATKSLAQANGIAIAHTVLAPASGDSLRDALTGSGWAQSPLLLLPEVAGESDARALAALDPDLLVDLGGMRAATARALAARPARAIVACAIVQPTHVAPLVDTVLDGVEALAAIFLRLASGLERNDRAPAAAAMAALWDDTVRHHQRHDSAAATAGYAEVLTAQPGFAPALHLTGLLQQAAGDGAAALRSGRAAVAAAPDFVEARLAAGETALAAGDAAAAQALAEEGLARTPREASLWRLLGLAALARHDGLLAANAFAQALLLVPADGEAHYNHGVALQMSGDVGNAARAYQRALTFKPDLVAADFNLAVIFQQQGNLDAAIQAFTQVLEADSGHVAAYKGLGEALFASGRLDAWAANFRRFEANCPGVLPLAVQALEVCQYAGDFAAVDRYLEGLRKEKFQAQNEHQLVDCLEELLYLLLFFDVEPEMIGRFAQTYDAAATRVYGTPLSPGLSAQPVRRPGRLRVGYLSADLRNHVMGKMMWQALAQHDRARFDLYLYSNSPARDEWTERFAGIATRFATIAHLPEREAAAVIAADDLDLLVDLSTHTRGARPGILALKPARVQITHVASAGTLGLAAIDYKLTDQFADVPENQTHQMEPLLAMDGCVYPYRHVAPAAAPTTQDLRASLGLTADTIVIGAFVSALKLSRRCLTLWREVLLQLPNARLAFSPVHPGHKAAYRALTAAAGIDPERLLFIPQGADDAHNQARYRIVDMVLDPLPFGGVNGTIEALDMQVPVVTLAGRRHGERTSYSILANLGVTATIAQSGRDYVAISVRLATDAAFMAEVRAAIAKGLAGSPLVDMPQHARNLEAAYRVALEQKFPGLVAAADAAA